MLEKYTNDKLNIEISDKIIDKYKLNNRIY